MNACLADYWIIANESQQGSGHKNEKFMYVHETRIMNQLHVLVIVQVCMYVWTSSVDTAHLYLFQ